MATSLLNNWGIRHKDDDQGTLILLVLSERKYHIEIGPEFEALFPNERVTKIGAEMVPVLMLKQYGDAVLSCSQTLARIVAGQRIVAEQRA
jgi:uncharacterized membrane protein YgcG